jgi:hypothetical protein
MPVTIGDKTYWTVAERLTLAHGGSVDAGIKPTGIQAIETRLEAVGGIAVVHATVTFQDGRRFTGMSMVNADSRSPAERNAPLETCETSAIGRALAFAGWFGSPEGIAGAEELHLAQQREQDRAKSQGVMTAPRTPTFADGSSPITRMSSGAAPRPVGTPSGPSPAQVRYASKLWTDAGRPTPPPDFEAMTFNDIRRLIDELKAEAAR